MLGCTLKDVITNGGSSLHELKSIKYLCITLSPVGTQIRETLRFTFEKKKFTMPTGSGENKSHSLQLNSGYTGIERARSIAAETNGNSADYSDSSSVLQDDIQGNYERDKSLQNHMYRFQVFLSFLHCIGTIYLLSRNQGVTFIVFFHGIVSPVTFVLYGIGIASAIYGFLGMYRKNELIPFERRAQWFRYYIRSNIVFLIVWVLSALGTIFGCWTFVYVERMPDYFPPDELVKSLDYEVIIKQLILHFPRMLEILEALFGLDRNDPPVQWFWPVGKYYYMSLIFLVAIPAGLLYLCIRRQRNFYDSYFMNKSQHIN